jgi:hypothetical protein
MNAEDWKKYRQKTLQHGLLSDDTFGVRSDGQITHTPTPELSLGEALAGALAVSEITSGFFNTAVAQGYIKLRYPTKQPGAS